MEKASKSAHVSSLVRRGDSTDLLLLQQGERYQFLRGPVPLGWLTAAAKLPGRSLHVGIALWFLSEPEASRAIRLTNVTASLFGVSRNAKYRALDLLEGAGLIRVARLPGHPPAVTLLGTGMSHDEPP
jgi:hypothetical protein